MIEEKVKTTILQDTMTVVIGGKEYKVPPPTPATLIMVSAEAAKLPKISNSNDVFNETMRCAKDCAPLGNIVAIVVLGAKRVRQNKRWWQRRSEYETLANNILEEMTIKEIGQLWAQLLSGLQIGDFFAITTSLQGINLTSPTREVETTAFGR